MPPKKNRLAKNTVAAVAKKKKTEEETEDEKTQRLESNKNQYVFCNFLRFNKNKL